MAEEAFSLVKLGAGTDEVLEPDPMTDLH